VTAFPLKPTVQLPVRKKHITRSVSVFGEGAVILSDNYHPPPPRFQLR